ncbi:MAG TPA: hypothetical protein VJ817_13440 [Gemmatimonadales bacterium]|nr:hypothetical protein [Gemmatimonadales bacterium]
MNSRSSPGHPLRSRRSPLALAALFVAAMACQAPPSQGPQVIAVTGSDYAFQLPDSLQAGTTVLHFNNVGKVDHEMGMALLKPGVTLAQVLERIKAGNSPDSLLDGIVGILIAKPGVTTLGGLSVELLPGRTYALFCNFQDGPDKPPHSSLGMVSSRTITAAP